MDTILFATYNKNKISEVKQILKDRYEVISLDDLGFNEDIPEPFDSIEENSKHKARYFFQLKNVPCVSEDSGLEVEALDGKPGAWSARYAGPEKNDRKNLEKVLYELGAEQNRKARFVSVFTYMDSSGSHTFRGEMNGNIHTEPIGENGFGYDPIFIPDTLDKTNAQLTKEEKNAISHRRKALDALIRYLETK